MKRFQTLIFPLEGLMRVHLGARDARRPRLEPVPVIPWPLGGLGASSTPTLTQALPNQCA